MLAETAALRLGTMVANAAGKLWLGGKRYERCVWFAGKRHDA